ncbi:hypothetical protein OH76DRAFT_1505318, partial [Lentinus brumalis]
MILIYRASIRSTYICGKLVSREKPASQPGRTASGRMKKAWGCGRMGNGPRLVNGNPLWPTCLGAADYGDSSLRSGGYRVTIVTRGGRDAGASHTKLRTVRIAGSFTPRSRMCGRTPLASSPSLNLRRHDGRLFVLHGRCMMELTGASRHH